VDAIILLTVQRRKVSHVTGRMTCTMSPGCLVLTPSLNVDQSPRVYYLGNYGICEALMLIKIRSAGGASSLVRVREVMRDLEAGKEIPRVGSQIIKGNEKGTVISVRGYPSVASVISLIWPPLLPPPPLCPGAHPWIISDPASRFSSPCSLV
jgi:hypothetical protein